MQAAAKIYILTNFVCLSSDLYEVVYTILVAHRGNITSDISRSAFKAYMSQHKDRKKDERAIYRMPVLKSLKKIKSSKRGLLQQ